jgi:hypothetical protein
MMIQCRRNIGVGMIGETGKLCQSNAGLEPGTGLLADSKTFERFRGRAVSRRLGVGFALPNFRLLF